MFVTRVSDPETFYPMWEMDGATEPIPGNIRVTLVGQQKTECQLYPDLIDYYNASTQLPNFPPGLYKLSAGQLLGSPTYELLIYSESDEPFSLWFQPNLELPSSLTLQDRQAMENFFVKEISRREAETHTPIITDNNYSPLSTVGNYGSHLTGKTFLKVGILGPQSPGVA